MVVYNQTTDQKHTTNPKYGMKTFEQWVSETHPEFLDENWKTWTKNAALGGALLGAGVGIGKFNSPSDQQQTNTTQDPLDVMRQQLIQSGTSPEAVRRMNPTQIQTLFQHKQKIGKIKGGQSTFGQNTRMPFNGYQHPADDL